MQFIQEENLIKRESDGSYMTACFLNNLNEQDVSYFKVTIKETNDHRTGIGITKSIEWSFQGLPSSQDFAF